jgi:hypothetical protein
LHHRRKTTNFAPDKRPQRGGENKNNNNKKNKKKNSLWRSSRTFLENRSSKTPQKERYQMHFNSIAKRIPEAITKCTATSEAAYQMTRSPPPHVT